MNKKRKNPFINDSDLDMTSLMDVVFLILIFFMITATFVKEKKTFKVELEKAQNGSDQKLVKEALTITISKEGNYAINEQLTGLYSKKEILDTSKNKYKILNTVQNRQNTTIKRRQNTESLIICIEPDPLSPSLPFAFPSSLPTKRALPYERTEHQ